MELLLQLLCAVFLSGVSAQTTLCGDDSLYTLTSRPYTFGSNSWNDDGSGSECITISADNLTFSATWQWQDNETSVHSFPNINLYSKLLPLQLSNISALTLQAEWSMAPESSTITPIDVSGLSDLDIRANVVLDLFVDPSSDASKSYSSAMYEIMVWIGKFGWALPLGFYGSGHQAVYELGGTIYKLYNGTNQNGQIVLSWLADGNQTTYQQDVTPLLEYLWQAGYLAETDYLHSCQYGTEAFHATAPVTFTTSNFNITLISNTSTVVSAGSPSNHFISGKGSWSSAIQTPLLFNIFITFIALFGSEFLF